MFKLLYNTWGAAILHTLAVYAPAMRDQLGGDFAVAKEVISGDGWMSLVCASKLDRMLGEDFSDPDFAIKHMVKDVSLARRVMQPSAHLDLLLEQYLRASEAAGADADYTVVTAVPVGVDRPTKTRE